MHTAKLYLTIIKDNYKNNEERINHNIMGKIIELKPKENNTNKTVSKPAQVIRFPNLRQYINIYEKTLNGKKDRKSIFNAFHKVNRIVANLQNPYEKVLEIEYFVDYFVESIDEKMFNDIINSYHEEPILFTLYRMFQEDEITEEGLELLEEMEPEFRKTSRESSVIQLPR